jgi:hypothetical protein
LNVGFLEYDFFLSQTREAPCVKVVVGERNCSGNVGSEIDEQACEYEDRRRHDSAEEQ